MDDDGYEFFRLREEGKLYFTKLFSYGAHDAERRRGVHFVFPRSDEVRLGEIRGALALRVTGETIKTQVAAVVSEDDKRPQRLSFETFRPRASGSLDAMEKEAFSFRKDEFNRLLAFLDVLGFVESNKSPAVAFQIEDISSPGATRKVLVDAQDRHLIDRLRNMGSADRRALFDRLRDDLSADEINILLGRKRGYEEFERQLDELRWTEIEWQDFFEREQWVFGYGLDYRILKLAGRNVTVGDGGGTDNKNKPEADFLMTFTNYTVLVEIKKPTTKLFSESRGPEARAGTWALSPQLIGGVSQVLEQKAKWAIFSQTHPDLFAKDGATISQRTRNAKAILVIGSSSEFDEADNDRDALIRRDTFELFRRETRGIDIVTFDELRDRAGFIIRNA